MFYFYPVISFCDTVCRPRRFEWQDLQFAAIKQIGTKVRIYIYNKCLALCSIDMCNKIAIRTI